MDVEFISEFEDFNEFLNKLNNELKFSNNNYNQAQIEVLNFLSNNKDVTAKQIEEVLNIDRGFLSRTLKSLQNNKLLKKTQSKKDKRIYILNISPKGKVVLEEYRSLKIIKYDEVFDHLSEEKKEEFIEVLKQAMQIFNNKSYSPILLENESTLEYVFNKDNVVWQAKNDKHIITTLLYKRVNEWTVELEFISLVEDLKIFKDLVKKAVNYAYDNFESHLIMYVDYNHNKYISIMSDLDFIETETLENKIRFDLFL
ncbi:MarR family winged helix-turn-helix transcriptional regulator [Nosocomiicoccus ampullae]|uniref:DNA-binding MarR family transcriptional regulator n=1 Tax=Nosocomiicoccus ampullae TaxID=489910 RepID=A0A9Q2CY70_9STAP|nr:MarR family winged helix-turn-helix transcriptional regulator [Nosocomiicoccus ampullae]MBB5175368.1 DNA-binding MarR family transcriptional regulator [Nosocomiicoccus ampullae]QYA46263.1 MarR family winged helix-turn-helix transcriptional regulator [Nosocomiicoccus ampullae]